MIKDIGAELAAATAHNTGSGPQNLSSYSAALRNLAASMKQPITFRLDPQLLAAARDRAVKENRTLTNYLETALKRQIADAGKDGALSGVRDGRGHKVIKRKE